MGCVGTVRSSFSPFLSGSCERAVAGIRMALRATSAKAIRRAGFKAAPHRVRTSSALTEVTLVLESGAWFLRSWARPPAMFLGGFRWCRLFLVLNPGMLSPVLPEVIWVTEVLYKYLNRGEGPDLSSLCGERESSSHSTRGPE